MSHSLFSSSTTSAPSFLSLLNSNPKVSREVSSPFGEMRIHKQQEPHWVWQFKRWQGRLLKIMLSLHTSKADFITDKQAKHCGIQLNPLDFQTGETSPSVTPYFIPTEEEVLVRQPACVLMRNKFITTSLQHSTSKSTSQSQSKRDRNLGRALSQEFEKYRRLAARRKRSIFGLESFDLLEDFTIRIKHDDKKVPISLPRTMRLDEGRRGRQCHQIAHLRTSEYPDPAHPSITELQVLITLIYDRVVLERRKSQMKDKLRRYDESAHRLTHYVFPTLVITIFPGAQARVLYGYFDGQLKVQYTEPQQVTTSNFEDVIGTLLKWSLPEMDGETTDVVALPTIAEEEEQEKQQANNIIPSPETTDTPTILRPQPLLHKGEDAIHPQSNNLTITTNNPTNTTTTSKSRYPKRRHSCSFHTCTVAAKNLVESRLENEKPSLEKTTKLHHESQQRKMFEKIRKKSLAPTKEKS